MTASDPTQLSDFDDDQDIWGSSSEGEGHPKHESLQTYSQSNTEDTLTALQSSDDFYGSIPHPSDPPSILALRRKHSKEGYLAGLTSHKEASLQKGFDEGFPEGATLGLKIGQILGKLNAICALSAVSLEVKNQAKILLADAKKECGIKKVLNEKYFDEELNLKDDGLHPIVDKWERYVEKFIGESLDV